jgi:CheY-like chemotaxis protein
MPGRAGPGGGGRTGDQDIVLELLADTGLLLDTASDGLEALACLDRQTYALILMDVQMPRLDGLACTRRIRQRPDGGRIPIIAMTANAFTEDQIRCREAGMNDFISKPVDTDSLFQTLHKWLSPRQRKRLRPGCPRPNPDSARTLPPASGGQSSNPAPRRTRSCAARPAPRRLSTLGDGHQVEAVGHVDDGPDDRGVLRVAGQVAHEGLVDLQLVDGQRLR